MKYMGAKTHLLRNGLGQILLDRARKTHRFVDLFCGSGVVAWHVATAMDIPVLAVDLQRYAAILAQAVISRTRAVDADWLAEAWFRAAHAVVANHPYGEEARRMDRILDTAERVREARMLCAAPSELGPVWNAYGGYYFSPFQALSLDALLRTLPNQLPDRVVAHAALIMAAASIAAAPGHTAQPLRPNGRSLPWIQHHWERDPFLYVHKALRQLAGLYARVPGQAIVADAMVAARWVMKNDLIFIDPPYSAVQYSRFYHVLETIAKGRCGPVEGAGRYPPRAERPQSAFSRRSDARRAFEELLRTLAMRGAMVIITFPNRECSNGLSATRIEEIARNWFVVERLEEIPRFFSTLGGTDGHRPSRQERKEAIVELKIVLEGPGGLSNAK